MAKTIELHANGGTQSLKLGDGVDALSGTHGGTLFFDPPWDAETGFDCAAFDVVVGFTDGRNLGRCVQQVGRTDMQWQFVWDCCSCWYTPNRPLKRHKSALWYGPDASFSDSARYNTRKQQPERAVKNSRGEHTAKSQPGTRMADLVGCVCDPPVSDMFQSPITALHSADNCHKHGKPMPWIEYIMGGVSRGTVFDPFAGGGAFMMTAMVLGFDYVGYEIDADTFEQTAKSAADFSEQLNK